LLIIYAKFVIRKKHRPIGQAVYLAVHDLYLVTLYIMKHIEHGRMAAAQGALEGIQIGFGTTR
jgi:hypothetical protein